MKKKFVFAFAVSIELADFGLAIEVIGEQTQWHGMYAKA